MAWGLFLHQGLPTHTSVSPVKSYPVGCYKGVDAITLRLKDQLYVNGEADESHGDEHGTKEHQGHCFTGFTLMSDTFKYFLKLLRLEPPSSCLTQISTQFLPFLTLVRVSL